MLSRMKSATWLIACPILMVLGFLALFQGVGEGTGTVSVNFGWPLSSNSLTVAGKVVGGWVLVWLLLECAAAVSFVAGVVVLMRANGQGTAAS